MSIHLSFYEELQRQQAAWSAHNFPARTPEQQLLGIVEELGELDEASENQDVAGIVDAVGDAMIFISDYCTLQGYPLVDLVERARALEQDADGTKRDAYHALGRLAKAHLKLVQKVRGSPAVLRGDARAALVMIINELDWTADLLGRQLHDVVREVWGEVRSRDWVKHPFDGKTR